VSPPNAFVVAVAVVMTFSLSCERRERGGVSVVAEATSKLRHEMRFPR